MIFWLDGTMAYLEPTISCVNCRKLIREKNNK
jgi:hypothetical protein